MDRDSFIKAAGEILQSHPLPRATRMLWELGRSSGVMTKAELDLLEQRHTPPQWLLQALGLDRSIPVSSDISTADVHPEEKVTCQPPCVIGDSIFPASFGNLTGLAPKIQVVSGKAATFGLGNFMRVALVDGAYVPSMTDVNNLWTWQLMERLTPHRLPGRTLVCVVEGSSFFSHWLLDTLPRFSVLQQFGLEPRNFDHVLIASAQLNFHREGLQAFNIAPSTVRTRKKIGPVVFCEEFVYVTPVRHTFLAGNWLYKAVADVFAPSASSSNRRIYISRAKAKRRRLINESDLYPILKQHDFQIVHAEELSVSSMATLCAEASFVVAPHGAGLANIAFMHGGGCVLELYGAHLSTEYWRICNSRGLRYYCMQGTDSEGGRYSEERLKSMSHFEINRADFKIDPDAFRDAVAAAVHDVQAHLS